MGYDQELETVFGIIQLSLVIALRPPGGHMQEKLTFCVPGVALALLETSNQY